MSRNNASFSANAAAFHNAHVQKLKTLDAEPVLTLTADGNVTQETSNVTEVIAHATKGRITMQSAVDATVRDQFTFTNRFITASSKILLTCTALTTSSDNLPGQCTLVSQTDGSCVIQVYNPDSAAATDSAPVIHYLILD